MGDTYTLTLRNASLQPNTTFAVYAMSPLSQETVTYPLVWLAQEVRAGDSVTFTWTLDFSLMFAPHGCRPGAAWTGAKSLDVTDTDRSKNTVTLDHSDHGYSFELASGKHPVEPGHVYIVTTGSVPAWTPAHGPSVALAIATGEDGVPTPAIAGDSGPDLLHDFALHPTYYIRAGEDVLGALADLNSVTALAQVTYPAGTFDAERTLDRSNHWVEGNPVESSDETGESDVQD